jgi:hypothetical protein
MRRLEEKTFLLHKRDIFLTETLSNEQLGELFAMMLRWQNCDPSERQSVKSDDALVNGFFAMFASRFANDEAEYQRACEVRRENGRRGGEANATKSKQLLPKESKASKSIPIHILSSPNNIYFNNNTNNSGIEGSTTEEEKEEHTVEEKGNTVNWRYISSVERASVNFDKDAIAELKKSRLKAAVESLGILTPEGVEQFINKWGEHNPGSETIKAEMEHIFDVAARAKNYMKSFGKGTGEMVGKTSVDFSRFADGQTYWKKNFTDGEVAALPFEARKHVLRGGAVKRSNGKWIID